MKLSDYGILMIFYAKLSERERDEFLKNHWENCSFILSYLMNYLSKEKISNNATNL